MLLQTWSEVLVRSFQELWFGIVGFVPNVIVAVIIFIAGWVVGSVLGKGIAQVIKRLNIDKLFRSVGMEETLGRAGINLNTGMFLGELVKWFIVVAFLIASLDVLGLNQVNAFLQQVVLGYLPNVIIAALILILAAVIADIARRIVTSSAQAAELPTARLIGGVTKWAIWIFALLAAAYQLGIAGALAQTLFTGIVAMFSIAGGLAFGLGGKEAASDFIEKLREDVAEAKRR
jgi:hypothetical protein